MKILITSVLITISCVVTAQNVKVKSSEPNYTVGVRNGTYTSTNKNTHTSHQDTCIGFIMGESNVHSKKIRNMYIGNNVGKNENILTGPQAGKAIGIRKVDVIKSQVKKYYLIGYVGEDSLGGMFAGGYDTALISYPNVEKMQQGIKRRYKLKKCFILSVTSYSSKERELFWETKTK